MTTSSEAHPTARRTNGGYYTQPAAGNLAEAASGSAVYGHQLAHGNMTGNMVADPNLGAVMHQFSGLSIPGHQVAGNAMAAGLHHGYVTGQDGAVPIFPLGYTTNPMHLGMVQGSMDGSFNPAAFQPQFSGNAPTAFIPYGAMPITPGRSHASYLERADLAHHAVPGLENRRDSYSTTESTPATPFFGTASDRGHGVRVSVVDRSNYTTPSPQQLAVSGMIGQVASGKPAQPIDAELEALLQQNPPIPRAVPAVFTPPQHLKTLEQCLENRILGNRNVYIRGLHPTTDDELLLQYAERFGEVETSKAIIDTSTGACKGFGFAKFKDVRNSEKCIRGFYYLGYEVGFARESFNARLKAEGDDNSTNLYLSNLPKRLTENELNHIFYGYHIVSSKILRDSMGNSRGVGFARFESRDECEEVIKKYHGASIGEECQLMNVRYADTAAQKELKRVTAERRQFRTNEYNIGAYGTADVGIHPTIYTQPAWNRRAAAGPHATANVRPTILGAIPRVGMVPVPPAMHQQQSATVSVKALSDDGSADEGVTIVDSPTHVKGSTQSSPAIKTEKP